jgi:two-component system, OmpR family, sensor histidine kinase KdpD
VISGARGRSVLGSGAVETVRSRRPGRPGGHRPNDHDWWSWVSDTTSTREMEPASRPRPATARSRLPRALGGYLASLGLVALASVLAAPAHPLVSAHNLSMLYLAVVVVSALYLGRGPAVLAAVAGVLALDFLFVPPRLALTVADPAYILTFVGLFVVGLVVSSLAAEVRDQARSAQQREAEARTLYECSRDLASAVGIDGIVPVIIRHVHDTFERDAVVLLPQAGRLRPAATTEVPLEPDALAAATWSFEHGLAAGRGTDQLPGAPMRFLPLKTSRGVLGVLGLHPAEQGVYASPERRRLLDVFASLAAVAIERAQFAEAAGQAELLRATEKLQSALLDSISHELRTPLVTITGALTALEGETGVNGPTAMHLDESARRRLLAVAREEAERLNRLVGELLDIARLEAGALRVAAVPADVEEIVGTALERLGTRLTQRLVTVDVPPDLPMASMDATLMVQVLVNLLDNAVKHGPPGQPIEVRAAASPEGVRIAVGDRGPGVPPADLERIFDKFHRVQRPGGASGTGLGLAICKGIVEAHGGRIGARNRTGGGLEIEVRLPAAEIGQ